MLADDTVLFEESTLVTDEVYFQIYRHMNELKDISDLKYASVYAKTDIDILDDYRRNETAEQKLRT